MPEIGQRYRRYAGGRVWDLEYRPDAQPFRGPYVAFDACPDGCRLGVPDHDAWVRVYGDGLNYPYALGGRIVGGPHA